MEFYCFLTFFNVKYFSGAVLSFWSMKQFMVSRLLWFSVRNNESMWKPHHTGSKLYSINDSASLNWSNWGGIVYTFLKYPIFPIAWEITYSLPISANTTGICVVGLDPQHQNKVVFAFQPVYTLDQKDLLPSF